MSPEGHKYLFDFHNFDQVKEPEPEIDIPPPPPTFSLEELGQAQQESFAQGRLAGLEEARLSREQYLAEQVNRLADSIKSVLLSEQMRANLFEKEVLHLCAAIFAKTFPLLNDTYGLSEVQNIIQKTVSSQPAIPILIEIPNADEAPLRESLSTSPDFPFDRVTIKGSPALQSGSCKISWPDGGAIRDHTALAQEITGHIEELLAPRAQKSDNRDSKGE